MKFGICCTFIVLAVVSGVTAQSGCTNIPFLEALQTKQCPTDVGFMVELNTQFQKLYHYATYAMYNVYTDKKAFCAVDQHRAYGLLKELVGSVKRCLAPEEQYAGDFLLTSADQVLHLACNDDRYDIEALLINNKMASECLMAMVQGGGAGNSNTLFPCAGDELTNMTSQVYPKNRLCDALHKMSLCFQTGLENAACKSKENIGLYNFLRELLNRATCPCHQCPTVSREPNAGNGPVENAFVVLGMVLLQHMFT